MNTDNIFLIGNEHKVCQDYALSGIINDTAYAIVSDGCSASPDVDFGARILSHAAKRKIIFRVNYPIFETNDIGKASISDASQIYGLFHNLHLQALDATLLIATVKDNILNAYLYGDGVIVHRSSDDVYITHIHLTSGAPDYLSYHLSKSRMANYLDMKDNVKEVYTNDSIEPSLYTPFTPFVIVDRPVKSGDTISVISDGINSFRTSDNTPIDWMNIIDDFTKYKNFEGEFVTRRMSAFKRKCLTNSISYYDDISVASIVV